MSDKARAWMTEDEYVGVSGVDTIEAMVKAIVTDGVADALRAGEWITASTAAAVRRFLDDVGVSPVKVPVAHFHDERWDGAYVSRLHALDERPGRGYVKVLGVALP